MLKIINFSEDAIRGLDLFKGDYKNSTKIFWEGFSQVVDTFSIKKRSLTSTFYWLQKKKVAPENWFL
jgi:hypothetical protein